MDRPSAFHPRNWPAVAVFAAGRLMAAAPSGVALRAGRLLGRVSMRLMRSRRLVVDTNLRACFPELTEAERNAIAQSNFEATACGLIETARALWTRSESLLADSEVRGLDHLESAYRAGNGVLMLGAHFTCAELACRIVNEHVDEPVLMLVRRNNNAWLERKIDRGRRAHCEQTMDKKELIAVRRALKKNRAVFYGPDQNFTYQSVFAPFFGIPAATVTATADLVGRSGAALVPFWAWRSEDKRYHVEIEPAWEDYPTGNPEADAARVNAWIEARIREHPEQYLWAHRRFRTRPEGEPPFYPPAARRAKHR